MHERAAHSTHALAALCMAFLLLPLLAVIPVSFTDKRFLSMPDEWSLRHYETLLNSGEWLSSIGTSLLVAFVASILATALAVSFGLGVWYLRSRLAVALLMMVMLPLAVPPVVSAMVLYFLGSSVGGVIPWLGVDTLGGVIIAHVIMVEPFAVVVILVALSRLDRRIEIAARSAGASLWQTTFLVILPNIRAGILSAWFLAFILSWEEIAVTLFVTSVNVITLPRRIWSGLRDALDPVIAAISAILILLTVLVVLGRALAPLFRRQVGNE